VSQKNNTEPWYKRCRLELCRDQGGRLHQVKGSAHGVYLALRLHANAETGIAWPAVDTIASGLGISRRSVQIALRSLEQAGMIREISKGGGRKSEGKYCTAGYQITPPSGATDCASKSTRGATDCAPRPFRGATECSQGRNPLRGGAQPTAPEEVLRGIEEQQQDAAADPGLARALKLAGVAEPARSELVELPGITPRLIREKSAWCRDRGKGVPVLIAELRLASEQHVERTRRQQHRQQASSTEQANDQPLKTYAELKAELSSA